MKYPVANRNTLLSTLMPVLTKKIIWCIPLLFSLHWFSIQAYVTWCAPPGFRGFYQSILTSPSPVCIALNQIQYYSIQYYYSIWVAVGILMLTTCEQKLTQLTK